MGSAAVAADEGATSCWTIYIADPHRPQRWRAQMMAMMTAIVRSGEAAASDRGREQDSNRGKCLTSPASRSLIHSIRHFTQRDRRRSRSGGRSMSRANCNCHMSARSEGSAAGGAADERIHRLIRHCRDRVDFSRRNATGGHVAVCVVGKGGREEGEPHRRIQRDAVVASGARASPRRREEKWFPRLIYNASPVQHSCPNRLKSHL